MAEKSVFEQIKKQNGEAFAKAIRNYDNGIFEIPDIVKIVKYAGREAEPILRFLGSLKDVKIEEKDTGKDPFQLLEEAGYNAYYADTLEKQNAIEKYFKPHERLCTFNDSHRFENYYIINAVRKDVDKIKRENFEGKEKREDEYGRSVISIQIAKRGGFISIKNRYNHTVECPDNTFYSNPDFIINGLSASLKKYFCTDFSSQPEKLHNNFIYVNKQIVHYHHEWINTYYGSDFYVKDGVIYDLDKDKEIMLDEYVLNIKDRTIYEPQFFIKPLAPLDEGTNCCSCYVDVLTEELKNKKIRIAKNKDGGRNVLANGVAIVSVKEGCITDLYLPTTKRIWHNFLTRNSTLKTFSAPQLEEIKDDFLYCNLTHRNTSLKKFYAPKLIKVGNNFLFNNIYLKEFYAPNLIKVGDGFLYNNMFLEQLDLPNVKKIGEDFLYSNKRLKIFNASQLDFVDGGFLLNNLCIEHLNLPNLRFAGSSFMTFNSVLKTLDAPKLKEGCDYNFLSRATYKTNAPVLINKIVSDNILPSNNKDEKTSTLMALVDMFNLCPVLAKRNIVCSKRLIKYEMKEIFMNFLGIY